MRAKPLHSSEIPPRTSSDRVGLLGATGMGFTPMPVQRCIYRLLDARTKDRMPIYPMVVIEVPRRAGKTDGVLSDAIGRCKDIPGYRVGYCAQSGIKSRSRFLDTVRALHKGGVGGYTPYRARGEESINFDNGSVMSFHPPLSTAFRGDFYDLVIIDEAQEHNDEDAADLVGSILPTMDTRPSAQLVVAGTAGASRDGLLWESLQSGRAGNWGILDFAAPDEFDADDETHWLDVHPGPAGVSRQRALEVLRMRHAQLTPEMFKREYLNIWPDFTVMAAFPAALWHSLGVDLPPARPPRYGLAFDCTPDGDRAAVCAVWRAGQVTWAGVLAEREGTSWVPDYVSALAIADRVPVWADSTPFNGAVMSEISRLHKQVRTHLCTSPEFASGCALLATEVNAATLRHSKQPDLDSAVAIAYKRPISDGGWGWGRRKSAGSIAPLVAVSVGLKAFDTLPAQRLTRALSAQVH